MYMLSVAALPFFWSWYFHLNHLTTPPYIYAEKPQSRKVQLYHRTTDSSFMCLALCSHITFLGLCTFTSTTRPLYHVIISKRIKAGNLNSTIIPLTLAVCVPTLATLCFVVFVLSHQPLDHSTMQYFLQGTNPKI